MIMDDEGFETVARFLNPSEAYIFKGRLEAEGIPAFVVDDNLAQTHSLIAVAIGGVRVQVPSGFIAQAKEIFKAMQAGHFALGDTDDFDKDH